MDSIFIYPTGEGHSFMENLQYASSHKGELKPDVIVFSGGWYPALGGSRIDELKKEAAECYQYAQKEFPEATIIVIGTEYREIQDPLCKQLNEALRKTALENKCYYIDLCSGETISSSRRNNIKRKGLISNRNRML